MARAQDPPRQDPPKETSPKPEPSKPEPPRSDPPKDEERRKGPKTDEEIFAEQEKARQPELVDDEGTTDELSTGDYRLLLSFLQRPKIVLSREQLLDLAFDRGSDVFDRAVDTQVSRLRRKIEADARTPKLIKTVWGGGYVFTAPVEKA